ncbi:MAG: hypothetical protein N4Q22_07520 [Lactobacillus crispatus]|nr:hypothetical protein [Lactobacillus crispatus]
MTKQTIKAQADGRNGQIDFEIDLENNKISDVKVTKNSETPAIFNQTFGKLKKNILIIKVLTWTLFLGHH